MTGTREMDITAPTPPARPSVLLVDDHAAGSHALARFLEASGFSVTTAADGVSAIEALRAGPPPQVVLTDLRLPDLDGREVARFARLLDPPPFVTMITGWDLDDDLRDCARWGISRVVTKPVDVRALIRVLRDDLGLDHAG